ncbi:TetR/AcrR family transcriptional regulator [Silvimonas iriomotensis]|uniref:TetR family transcriptional regulator n=1 Tax=Silvimonas iriomotensis TaxID=449662 RepID=A0ABQ2P4R3_9NEIS|nr:TetR/AcrR family transcriptional regulator [Silvimonas iriomotensis]GGP18320.1 TetR family transcriptional regulator [Silvimonas iriomotensis]
MQVLPNPRKSPRQARSQLMVETILQATARVLSERGLAGTNTNAVAERAGVSVGSVYQYFPNKEALINALHERHVLQMETLILDSLDQLAGKTLLEAVECMIEAVHEAHLLEPALHRALENGDLLCDPNEDDDGYRAVMVAVRQLFEVHRATIKVHDLDLAVWSAMKIVEIMVHSAVLSPPPNFTQCQLRCAIVDAVMGYLVYPSSVPAHQPPGELLEVKM